MKDQKRNSSIINITNHRLRRTYWIAISIIAVAILLNNILVNNVISNQTDDSSVINIAGRQRMLSQKLAKEITLILKVDDSSIGAQELAMTLSEWTKGHEFLLDGAIKNEKNNTILLSLFFDIKTHYEYLKIAAANILEGEIKKNLSLEKVLNEQARYLEIMERIVSRYETEAKAKITKLRKIERYLTAFALLVLLLEILFLFRPAAKYIETLVNNLSSEKVRFKQIAEENHILLDKSEMALKELRSLNYAIDRTSLFASLDLDGSTLHLSEKFISLLQLPHLKEGDFFHEIISTNEGEQQYIKEILLTPRSDIWQGEIQITTQDDKPVWLDMSIVPFNKDGIKQHMLILCNELTQRKEAFKEIERLNQEQFESEIKAQREKAIQVMDAQESERKRIAKDMHDGIGQMLTALKFNLQSVNLDNPVKAKEKLSKITNIASDLIKGVRIATFNLTPPELGDYGIAKGIAKLSEGLNNLTGHEIVFTNKTNFNQRFDFNTEINIYRIVQEAVNNAIKYSESEYVIITCSHSADMLSITVDDNGRGFDKSTMFKGKNGDGTGMGLSFMNERISYLSGRLFISSAPNKGTKVTINIPL